MVDDESLRRNRNATPQFIGALTEMVWVQIGMLLCRLRNRGVYLTCLTENVAIDLETFSRHAGRTTITTDDVLLLARRNNDLHAMIKNVVDRQKAAKLKDKKGKGR